MTSTWCSLIFLGVMTIKTTSLQVHVDGTDTNVTLGSQADLVYNMQLHEETLQRIHCTFVGVGDSRPKPVYTFSASDKNEGSFTRTLAGRARASLHPDNSKLTLSILETTVHDDGTYICTVYGNMTHFPASARLLTYTAAMVYLDPQTTHLNATVLEPVLIRYSSSCSKPAVKFYFRAEVLGKITGSLSDWTGKLCGNESLSHRTEGVFSADARVHMKIMVVAEHPSFHTQHFNYTVQAVPRKVEESRYGFRNVAIIAGCVGGGVLLAVVIIVAVYTWKRRHRVTTNRRKQVPLDDRVLEKDDNGKELTPLKNCNI